MTRKKYILPAKTLAPKERVIYIYHSSKRKALVAVGRIEGKTFSVQSGSNRKMIRRALIWAVDSNLKVAEGKKVGGKVLYPVVEETNEIMFIGCVGK